MILNGIEVVKGFNINDKEQAFTEQILAGVKTEGTRKTGAQHITGTEWNVVANMILQASR